MLIIVRIAWLAVHMANMPRGLTMPIRITTLAAVIIPLNFVGASAQAQYSNLLCTLVALGLIFYLCLRCLRIHPPWHLLAARAGLIRRPRVGCKPHTVPAPT